MKHQKDAKRKQVLAQRSIDESFAFQVWWGRNQKAPDIPDDSPLVLAEIKNVCSLGLAKDMLVLRDIVSQVFGEFGIMPNENRGTLIGSPTAYLLGITPNNPATKECIDMTLADSSKITLPFQVEIYYDNDVRNRIVDWVKQHYDGVTTRFGQSILKLDKMVVCFQRVLKK